MLITIFWNHIRHFEEPQVYHAAGWSGIHKWPYESQCPEKWISAEESNSAGEMIGRWIRFLSAEGPVGGECSANGAPHIATLHNVFATGTI